MGCGSSPWASVIVTATHPKRFLVAGLRPTTSGPALPGVLLVRQSQRRTPTLAGAGLLWLLPRHVLPKGFRRSRDYGFLHPNRKRLIRLRHLVLKVVPPPPQPKVPRCCRACGGTVSLAFIPFLAHLRAPSPPQVAAGSPAM